MLKLIAFGGSSSKNSINKTFAAYTAQQFATIADIEILDLNDYPLPLYSIDLEKEAGIPANAVDFYEKIQSADFLVISMAEHNGSYTAAFKNLLDWMSRYQQQIFADKKMLLLSTSPGGRGGKGVMDTVLVRFPIHGANIIGHFSLPQFQLNFDKQQGVVNPELKVIYDNLIESVKNAL